MVRRSLCDAVEGGYWIEDLRCYYTSLRMDTKVNITPIADADERRTSHGFLEEHFASSYTHIERHSESGCNKLSNCKSRVGSMLPGGAEIGVLLEVKDQSSEDELADGGGGLVGVFSNG
jgi:hypothetical protein